MPKRKNFKCKNDAQKRAIKANYARRSKNNNSQSVKVSEQKEKPKFKLPLKNGGHRWNIYKVPNKILNGKQDNDVHGGLVIDEENGNVMLTQVTHSAKKGKRNNIKISNLRSTDLEKDSSKQKDSFIERRLIVSVNFENGVEGIEEKALGEKINDLCFSEDEKQRILEELSNLSTAEDRYKLFMDLANKKDDT